MKCSSFVTETDIAVIFPTQNENDQLVAELTSMKEKHDIEIELEESDKEIQIQKITRLQSSLKVSEAEIDSLNKKVNDLEEQVLHLEHKNGKLILDGQQNLSLKHQIQNLQEEIIKDTNLRKELLSSLELAKSSLHTEIRNLEKSLQQ